MAKGHSFTTPRSGRNSAPYKTRIESRGGEVTSDGKDSWIFCYYDEHGKLVWRGHVNEEGVVVRDKPLEIKVDRVSKTEDDETRIKKNEVYLLPGRINRGLINDIEKAGRTNFSKVI